MRIRNNIMAVNSSRNRGIAQGKLNKSLEKLSTGYRINRAGDDAAGLGLSEQMRSQINGLDQAVRNTEDGIGLSNTGEGALTEVHSMLQRLKTLAIESANGTYDTVARGNIDEERLELLDEIDRISGCTDFNGIPLFENAPPAGMFQPPTPKDNIQLQIGHTKDETLDVTRYYLGKEALKLDTMDFTDQSGANAAVEVIDTAIRAVTTIRSSFGAVTTHLEHTNNNLRVTSENMTAFESGIRDTDMASEFTDYTVNSIINQSAQAMLTQANGIPQTVLTMIQG